MIINALGGLDDPNSGVTGGPSATSRDLVFGERAFADARASGLTAVNVTLGYVMGDFPPYEHTLDEIAFWDDLVAAHPESLLKVLTADDLRRADSEGRVGVIYGLQNAVQTGADPARVATLAKLGIRVVQLTYNPANQLGSGCMDPSDGGLTPFGRDIIDALNEQRLMVDLSHSGERTCLDAIAHSTRPVSINHTGCRALTDLPRNKTDAELRQVAERGGFVGIYFMPFLNPSGHATAEDVVAHLKHAVNVCGEDHVGIGTDGSVTAIEDLDAYRVQLAEEVAERARTGSGATGEAPDTLPFVPDLTGPGQFRRLAHLLEREGWTGDRVTKILGANFLAFATRTWPT
ncbi:dipeptidase [Actinomadura rupiterrae]|uniref:dipeptidase n=1 Tax=Actinomadura rupiterrae TaxID=559627 RepID=UPI0020A303F5|nr:membrane dipeptidase [Actinomadura rupiterrae]MCP2337779.1 membrane dipeptidase [Actinomadura rupiterrae]